MAAFVPTRAAGLSRLREFTPKVARYSEDRDFDRPGNQAVSRLSPWIQRRLLTEPEVIGAVRQGHDWTAVEKFAQEVCWRTYWKGWMEYHPEAWSFYREAVTRLRRAPPAGYAEALAGRTGIDGFDSWAKQLVEEGWLHNHARMWFASIWIFTLRLPWELGADFFLRHLLDGDPASNTLSWRWVAGLHTRGKVYLAKADNIARHTGGRHRPEGRLAVDAQAVTEPPLPPAVTPWTPGPELATAPGPVGLWLHPEDLSPEVSLPGLPTPAVVVTGWSEAMAEEQAWDAKVVAFTQAALADAAGRAAETWGVPVETLRAPALGAAVAEWAQRRGLRSIVALRPWTGPWLEVARDLEAAGKAVGLTVRWGRRDWDTRLIPYSSRGFFPFWNEARAWLTSSLEPSPVVSSRVAPPSPAHSDPPAGYTPTPSARTTHLNRIRNRRP